MLRLGCGRWLCTACGPRKRAAVFKRARTGISRYDYFLTVDSESWTHLRSVWPTLKQWIYRRFRGCKVLLWSNEIDQRMDLPHKHVLISGAMIDGTAVEAKAASLGFTSALVRRLPSRQDSERVIKYILKAKCILPWRMKRIYCAMYRAKASASEWMFMPEFGLSALMQKLLYAKPKRLLTIAQAEARAWFRNLNLMKENVRGIKMSEDYDCSERKKWSVKRKAWRAQERWCGSCGREHWNYDWSSGKIEELIRSPRFKSVCEDCEATAKPQG